MSMAIALYGHAGDLRWSPWTGEPLPALERGFAWIDVVDPQDEEIALLQRRFGLHDLAIEDSMSDAQPAKLDAIRCSRATSNASSSSGAKPCTSSTSWPG